MNNLWRFVVAGMAVAAICLVPAAVGGNGKPAQPTHVVHPAGYVVAQGKKDGSGNSLCDAPRVCYGPAQIQQAYDFPKDKKKSPTGAGQTIVIVVAYGSPTILDDLQQFDSTFDIPAPPSFDVVNGTGVGGVGSGDVISWAVETAAGVEWAHALAPGARIVLAVSPTDDISDIVATEAQILPQYPGAIVNQSFGDDETDPTAQDDFATLHDVFAAATAAGGSIVAGAGDFGATDGGPSPVAAYPGSDPLVTSVGGTEGNPYPDGLLEKNGKYGDEQVWNESDTFGAATGGAPSVLFDAPGYQAGVTGYTARTTPDVAFNAAINGGIQVYVGLFGRFITFGGTSAAAPQWAAILALADEARAKAGAGPLGAANAALYSIGAGRNGGKGDFHDITVGNNALPSLPGFEAGRGYDLATGLGTPDVDNLIRDLVKAVAQRHDDDGGPKPGHGLGPGDHHMKPDR